MSACKALNAIKLALSQGDLEPAYCLVYYFIVEKSTSHLSWSPAAISLS